MSKKSTQEATRLAEMTRMLNAADRAYGDMSRMLRQAVSSPAVSEHARNELLGAVFAYQFATMDIARAALMTMANDHPKGGH